MGFEGGRIVRPSILQSTFLGKYPRIVRKALSEAFFQVTSNVGVEAYGGEAHGGAAYAYALGLDHRGTIVFPDVSGQPPRMKPEVKAERIAAGMKAAAEVVEKERRIHGPSILRVLPVVDHQVRGLLNVVIKTTRPPFGWKPLSDVAFVERVLKWCTNSSGTPPLRTSGRKALHELGMWRKRSEEHRKKKTCR